MIEKLSHHYSMENPASIYDEEALTALELAGRTTAKVNETVEAFNNLNTETNEHLNAQDNKIDSRLTAQDNKIETRLTKQENEIIPDTVADYQQELIDNGTFNNSINTYAGNLSARVDNLLGSLSTGSTSSDAELIDIRTDFRSQKHATAGDAIRHHMTHFYNSFDRHYYGSHLIYFNWVQGGINTDTGATDTSANRIRTTNSYRAYDFTFLNFSNVSGVLVGVVYYYAATDTEAAYYKCVWLTPGTWHVVDQNAYSYRLIAKKTDDSAITPSAVTWLHPRTELYGDFTAHLRKIMRKQHFAIDHSHITPTLTADTNLMLFVNGRTPTSDTAIPAGSVIRKLTLHTKELSDKTVKIGIWYLNGDMANLVYEKEVKNVQGTFTVDLNYHNTSDAIVSVYSDSKILKYQTDHPELGMWASYQVGATEINTTWSTHLSRWGMTMGAKLEYETYELPASPTTLEVGPGRRFTEIRDAVESITDNGVYTIMVYPRAQPYKNFSMIRKMSLGEDYIWHDAPVRNISIIGTDRVKCVVESNTGDYNDPPCEPLCNGTIKNLTFRATHSKQNASATKGSYAAHIDCQTLNDVGYEMRFENCAFISDNGPGAGIGLHENCHLIFKDCEFNATGDTSYTPHDGYSNIVNYGAIFCHTDGDPDIPNQHLTLENCRIFATNANKTLWCTVTGENGDFLLTAHNNVIYTHNPEGVKTSIEAEVTLDPTSFGNNAPELNAE